MSLRSLRSSRLVWPAALTAAGLAGGFWAASGFAAQTAGGAKGTLEVCKDAANSAAGQTFTFTATSGTKAPITATVAGGSCSAPLPAQAGNWVILEDLSSGLWLMQGATAQ